MPEVLAIQCDQPGCHEAFLGSCTLTFYDHRKSDLILSHGDEERNTLHSDAKAAGWTLSLGDWCCGQCNTNKRVADRWELKILEAIAS